MSAAQLLARVRDLGITLTGNGDRLHYEAPRGVLTSELRQSLAAHKPQVLAELEREADQERRRRQVIEMLRRRSEIHYAYLAERQANGDGLVMLGIRGIGTGELHIPAASFDPLQVALLLDAAMGGSPS